MSLESPSYAKSVNSVTDALPPTFMQLIFVICNFPSKILINQNVF